jgi:hypothetical protein
MQNLARKRIDYFHTVVGQRGHEDALASHIRG